MRKGATFRTGKEVADTVAGVVIGAEVAPTMTPSAEKICQMREVKVEIAAMMLLETTLKAA